MKRMHYLLAGLIIPAMLTSCSSEDGVVETPIAPSDKDLPVVKLYANSGGSDTRTTIDGSGTVYWSQSDKINVNGQTSSNAKLTPDRRTAIFEVVGKSPFAAVYPASVATKFDGKIFTLQVPSEQRHKDGGSFADDVNISVAYSDTEELYFKNVCGLLKATIKADDGATLSKIKKVRFNAGTGTGAYISGAAKLDPKTGVITFSGATNTYIDVVFDTPKTITGAEEIKVIWSLPPKTYSNWTIELYDEDGNILKTIPTISSTGSNPPITITRSVITPVTQVYPQYYTVEIKGDNTTTIDGKGKNWMYKGEKRTFKINRIAVSHYSFYKWTATPQEPGNDEMKEPTLIVTASNNQVFEALTIKGTLIPLYDDEGLNETGKKILFSLPLASDGVFFEDNDEDGTWASFPSASKVKCPAGWRFPTQADHVSASKFLLKERAFIKTTERYSFNWYPTMAKSVPWIVNVSPMGTVIVHDSSSLSAPTEGYTRLEDLSPTDADGPYPVRCVKDFD